MTAMLSFRHGCLFLTLLCAVTGVAAQQAGGDTHVRAIKTQTVEVHYDVAHGSPGLLAVELWYTTDEGKSWLRYGADADRVSPVAFRPPAVGLYGFYIVVSNQAGASSGPPQSGTAPHAYCLVDRTAPVVQLHTVATSVDSAGGRTVNLGWSAYDTHPAERGIAIYYQRSGRSTWQLIESGVPNVKQYRWQVPAEVSGPVRLKLAVVDRAGNLTERTSAEVVLDPPAAPSAAQVLSPAAVGRTSEPSRRRQRQQPPSPSDARRARKLCELGSWHLVRGELGVASERFGEALELDPTLLEARSDLAGVLYDQGRFERALREYRRVLALSPTEAHALMGSALSHVGLKEFSKASLVLEQMLLTEPENGETWLNLGDVGSMMGGHARARMCWQKAAEYSPAGSETLLHARRRLKAYPARR